MTPQIRERFTTMAMKLASHGLTLVHLPQPLYDVRILILFFLLVYSYSLLAQVFLIKWSLWAAWADSSRTPSTSETPPGAFFKSIIYSLKFQWRYVFLLWRHHELNLVFISCFYSVARVLRGNSEKRNVRYCGKGSPELWVAAVPVSVIQQMIFMFLPCTVQSNMSF